MQRILNTAARSLLLNPKECVMLETIITESIVFVKFSRFGQVFETYITR